MVHVKPYKNPRYAVISETYLENMLKSLTNSNSKQVKANIESALQKIKDAQQGKNKPRQLTDYQRFSAEKYKSVREDLKNETGEDPSFDKISSRIGAMWRKEKTKKEENVDHEAEMHNENNNVKNDVAKAEKKTKSKNAGKNANNV